MQHLLEQISTYTIVCEFAPPEFIAFVASLMLDFVESTSIRNDWCPLSVENKNRVSGELFKLMDPSQSKR